MFKAKSSKLEIFTILVIILSFISASIFSVRDENPVIDEVAHIVSGYVSLRYANFNVNLEHPPLVKMIAAIPLLPLDINYQPSKERLPDEWDQGQTFLYKSGIFVDTILIRARSAVVVFNALLLFLIGILALSFFKRSWFAALLVFFLAFEPNLLAHSHYVTTDTPLAYASVGLLLSLLLLTRKSPEVSPETKSKFPPLNPKSLPLASSRGLSLIAFVFFATCVLLIKFSGVLVLAFAGTVLILWLRKRKGGMKIISTALLVPLLASYLIYIFINWNVTPNQFRSLIRTVPGGQTTKDLLYFTSDYVLTKPIASSYVGFRNALERAKLDVSGFPQFLDGEFKNPGSWRAYFPKAFLYKESPSILVLVFLSLIVFCYVVFKKRKVEQESTIIFTLLVLLWAISILSGLNIGIRHIAPILALQILFSFTVLEKFSMTKRVPSFLLSTVYWLLVTAQFVSIATTYPYFLSYFNAPSGGFEKGYTHLIDSNLDWGENKKRLAQWVYANNIPKISVDYWGNTEFTPYDPEARIQNWTIHGNGIPTSGYFAIAPMWIKQSAWKRSIGQGTEDYTFLENLKPVKMFGGGLWVYKLP